MTLHLCNTIEPVLSSTVRSPSIKRSIIVKVPKIMSLNYCNFDLY